METDGVDELEAALRRKGEVAIDLEERGTKKGTPPKPSAGGDTAAHAEAQERRRRLRNVDHHLLKVHGVTRYKPEPSSRPVRDAQGVKFKAAHEVAAQRHVRPAWHREGFASEFEANSTGQEKLERGGGIGRGERRP